MIDGPVPQRLQRIPSLLTGDAHDVPHGIAGPLRCNRICMLVLVMTGVQ